MLSYQTFYTVLRGPKTMNSNIHHHAGVSAETNPAWWRSAALVREIHTGSCRQQVHAVNESSACVSNVKGALSFPFIRVVTSLGFFSPLLSRPPHVVARARVDAASSPLAFLRRIAGLWRLWRRRWWRQPQRQRYWRR